MPTRYEEQFYADIHSIAVTLKEILMIYLEQHKKEIEECPVQNAEKKQQN